MRYAAVTRQGWAGKDLWKPAGLEHFSWPTLHHVTDNHVDKLTPIIRVQNARSSEVRKHLVLKVWPTSAADFLDSANRT